MTHPNVSGKPATGIFAVTPSDTVNFTVPARSLYIGQAGDVTVVAYTGEVETFYNVPVGSILPLMCLRVNATDTDADLIVGLT